MSHRKPRNPIPDPIPDDPQEQLRWAQRLAQRNRPWRAKILAAVKLRPAERIRLLYPLGVHKGALETMKVARAMPRRKGQREPLETGEADLWAGGLAAGITVPPKVMFKDTTVERTCQMIYYAGARFGALRALDHLGLRTGGI